MSAQTKILKQDHDRLALYNIVGVQINNDLLDLRIAHQVLSSGQFNRFACRIPINSRWNIAYLTQELAHYNDFQVVEWLKFGFPVSRHPLAPDPTPSNINHLGAINYPNSIENYIIEEKQYDAIMGPFNIPPFISKIGVSPLNTRAKKDSHKRRIILDLSWPKENAVNTYISSETYLGNPIKLTYPTIDDLTQRIAQLGKGCLLWKRDASRYFRQIPVCPSDYSLLGWRWRGLLYFDKYFPMGLVSAAYVAQRVSSALTYIHARHGFYSRNYLDDFGSAETPQVAWASYLDMADIFQKAGLMEAMAKAVAPTTCMEFLGVTCNTVTMTIQISPNWLIELKQELNSWLHFTYFTRRKLESLIGKLQFVTNCVRAGRVFIAQLIGQLSNLDRNETFDVTEEMKLDIHWWLKFMETYNGISILWLEQVSPHNAWLATDSSLTAMAGVHLYQYFTVKIPDHLSHLRIVHFEFMAILIACKLWKHSLHGKQLLIECDNKAVVSCINSGRAQEENLKQMLRCLAHVSATNEFWVRATYINTKSNIIPDKLSRVFQDVNAQNYLCNHAPFQRMRPTYVHESLLTYDCVW